MRAGNDYNRCRVIEKRIIAQRDADVDPVEMLEALVEHQGVEPSATSEAQRLFPRTSSRDLISLFLEYGFHRATHPLVGEANQRCRLIMLLTGHRASCVMDG